MRFQTLISSATALSASYICVAFPLNDLDKLNDLSCQCLCSPPIGLQADNSIFEKDYDRPYGSPFEKSTRSIIHLDNNQSTPNNAFLLGTPKSNEAAPVSVTSSHANSSMDSWENSGSVPSKADLDKRRIAPQLSSPVYASPVNFSPTAGLPNIGPTGHPINIKSSTPSQLESVTLASAASPVKTTNPAESFTSFIKKLIGPFYFSPKILTRTELQNLLVLLGQMDVKVFSDSLTAEEKGFTQDLLVYVGKGLNENTIGLQTVAVTLSKKFEVPIQQAVVKLYLDAMNERKESYKAILGGINIPLKLLETETLQKFLDLLERIDAKYFGELLSQQEILYVQEIFTFIRENEFKKASRLQAQSEALSKKFEVSIQKSAVNKYAEAIAALNKEPNRLEYHQFRDLMDLIEKIQDKYFEQFSSEKTKQFTLQLFSFLAIPSERTAGLQVQAAQLAAKLKKGRKKL